jgi:hypothetical protein
MEICTAVLYGSQAQKPIGKGRVPPPMAVNQLRERLGGSNLVWIGIPTSLVLCCAYWLLCLRFLPIEVMSAVVLAVPTSNGLSFTAVIVANSPVVVMIALWAFISTAERNAYSWLVAIVVSKLIESAAYFIALSIATTVGWP